MAFVISAMVRINKRLANNTPTEMAITISNNTVRIKQVNNTAISFCVERRAKRIISGTFAICQATINNNAAMEESGK